MYNDINLYNRKLDIDFGYEKKFMFTYKELNYLIRKNDINLQLSLFDELNRMGICFNDVISREGLAKVSSCLLNNGTIPNVSTKVLNYFVDCDELTESSRLHMAYVLLRGIFPMTEDRHLRPNSKATVNDIESLIKFLKYKVIDLLITNDIHGNAEIIQNSSNSYGGMGIVGGIIKERRKLNPSGTLLVDGGDAWQGTLISNIRHGELIIKTMENLNYDVATIGNHDFDFGLESLVRNLEIANFPFVIANIVDEKNGEKPLWSKPYVIIEKKGIKIGIIGFLTEETLTTTKSSNINGIKINSPKITAKDLVEELHKRGCDLVIIISHQGVKLKNDPDEETKGELVNLANSLNYGSVNAIVGGHVHQKFRDDINGIPIIICHSSTQAVGHMQFFLDKENLEVIATSTQILGTDSDYNDIDLDVNNLVETYKISHEDKMNKVITRIKEPLWGHSYRFEYNGRIPRDGVNPLGNIIADAMREFENTDISFVNVGTIRAELEDPGDITYKDLYAILPLGNYNRIGKMNAYQIKEILEVPDKYSGLPAMQFSGLMVEWDGTQPIGRRYKKILHINGEPIYVDGEYSTKEFSVATTDFMSTGQGDGYNTFAKVTNWADGELMLDALINVLKLKKEPFLESPDDGRDYRIDVLAIENKNK